MADSSWDGLKENADDHQRSGGKIRYGTEGPIAVSSLEVRSEDGKVIGELVVEELIPLKPTAWKDTSVRMGIWQADPPVSQSPVKVEDFKRYHGEQDRDAFPDEDDIE